MCRSSVVGVAMVLAGETSADLTGDDYDDVYGCHEDCECGGTCDCGGACGHPCGASKPTTPWDDDLCMGCDPRSDYPRDDRCFQECDQHPADD